MRQRNDFGSELNFKLAENGRDLLPCKLSHAVPAFDPTGLLLNLNANGMPPRNYRNGAHFTFKSECNENENKSL